MPVQGPLPQDPEDAPFLKNESGIRKLFAFITSRVSTVSSELQAVVASGAAVQAAGAAAATGQKALLHAN